MNTAIKTLSLMVLYCVGASMAAAQQASPSTASPADSAASAPSTGAVKPLKKTAQSEAGEPRAATSNTPVPTQNESPTRAPLPALTPPTAAVSVAPSTGHSAGAGRAAVGSAQKSAGKTDRLALGTATVTGSQEQPKVMYIVPWKRSDIGDLAGKPMNSLVDEILAPVDRDVFKREVVYYQAVQADASQNAAPPKPAQQGEK